MRHRFLAVILIVVLLIAAVPQYTQAASDVCFVSINDTLPDSIPFAYVSNSVTYIPSSALSSFRIYFLYDSNISTVLVYTSAQQVTIDMIKGVATDKDGVEYAATAIYRNGQVYVPAQFICSMFGLNASYIEGVGYGDICRITDGSEMLGDELFLSAATNQMRTRYNAYMASIAPSPTPSYTPPEPDVTDPTTHDDVTVYLAFTGLPTSYLLNLLKNYRITAAFFLTAADIAAQPETVRRIVGEGHNVGIYCPDGTLREFDATAELLFEAAHVRTVLVSAGEAYTAAFSQECEGKGLVPIQFDLNGLNGGQGVNMAAAVTGPLSRAHGNTVLMLTLSETNDTIIRGIIYSMYSNSYQFDILLEVGYLGGTHRVT